MVVQCHTFLFADLVGFTAFTERHGDDAAADVAERFAGTATGLAAEHGARLVKCLGDAVLLRVDEAAEALRLGLRLSRGADALPVHVGVHTGRAVARGADWYGSTVNLAARVADAAATGELLATAATVEHAGRVPGLALEHRGARAFKNVAAGTELYAVRG
jgi:adenylate cyclase